jgi:hypothetical protein
MKFINNEKGAALIYVIMISVVFTIFVSAILVVTSNSERTAIKSENQKEASNLAVSGMQSLLSYSALDSVRLDYLTKSDIYGGTGVSIPQPDGGVIIYRQYLVPATFTDVEALDLTHFIPPNAFSTNTAYKVVTTATIGDKSPYNQIKDIGEDTFQIYSRTKIMGSIPTPTPISSTTPTPTPTPSGSATPTPTPVPSSLKAITAFSFTQQTGLATIDSVNRTIIIEVTATTAGTNLANLVADLTISTGATAKVGTTIQALNCSGLANRGCSTANNFSNSISTPFKYTITAADATTNDWTVVVTQVGGAGASGVVWAVDTNGNRTPQAFGNSLSSTTTLIITSSVGVVTSPNNYSFSATNGIVIEPGVSITTTGTNTTVTLASSAGSIVLTGTTFKSTGNGNSNPYDISLNAALDVDIRGTTVQAERQIDITAGGSIFAQNAIVNSFKNNGGITFSIVNPTIVNPNNSKIFHVDSLKINQNATAGTSGIKICGALASGSSNINGFSSFTGAFCN